MRKWAEGIKKYYEVFEVEKNRYTALREIGLSLEEIKWIYEVTNSYLRGEKDAGRSNTE